MVWKSKINTENSNDSKLKMYVKKREINVNRYKNETIKRWIYNTKEFEKKMEKTLINNIRRYFELQNMWMNWNNVRIR